MPGSMTDPTAASLGVPAFSPGSGVPPVPRHRAQRPGPGVQMLLRRTRLGALTGPPPPPLVLLGRPGTTPDSIPHMTTSTHQTAALRPAGLRVLLAALVAFDPDENSRARRRAAASGLHPVDTSGAPVLTYRVKPGDDLE